MSLIASLTVQCGPALGDSRNRAASSSLFRLSLLKEGCGECLQWSKAAAKLMSGMGRCLPLGR